MSEEVTYDDILMKMVITVTGNTVIVDRIASWGMAGIGATLIMLISNVNNFIWIFDENEFRVIIGLLLFSLLLGIIEKSLFLIISTNVNVAGVLDKYLKDNDENIEDGDLIKVLDTLKNKIIPWYKKRSMTKMQEAGAGANEKLLISIGRSYNRQLEFMYSMALSFIVAVFFLVYYAMN